MLGTLSNNEEYLEMSPKESSETLGNSKEPYRTLRNTKEPQGNKKNQYFGITSILLE